MHCCDVVDRWVSRGHAVRDYKLIHSLEAALKPGGGRVESLAHEASMGGYCFDPGVGELVIGSRQGRRRRISTKEKSEPLVETSAWILRRRCAELMER